MNLCFGRFKAGIGALILLSIGCRSSKDERLTIAPVPSLETKRRPDPSLDPPPPQPLPAPTVVPSDGGPCNDFDKSALTAAMKAVPYKGCGVGGGVGKVIITLEPTGSVRGVAIIGAYSTATKACIETSFRAVQAPPFCGDAKTIGWAIEL